ncbi:hypothetical protein FSW04_02930 [Baekduia soli]|uniref:Beta-glucuronidase n=1 Tax=Baekduia soli TaxID=496014 RepID=A0A5B8U0X1_9ACTN|nr:glycoside hydrolase family 2 TIM barrel-domain containing protein [Baekduia soli]QEC46638.1 hypothetical protein FSW04_02930 [Baekduia soli]
MRHRGLRLVAVAALVIAVLAAGSVVVAGAMSARTQGESLVPPQAYGGPAGRLEVAGPWVQALDPGDRGERAGFAAGHFPGALVTVPHVANAAQVTGAAGVKAYAGGIAWYRTTLTAPETGSYALRFESVHHVATVWLDGRLLGSHTGAYLPFEFTLRLRAAVPHTLVVRADYRHPSHQKREGWHRTWFNYGGINREVTLRPLAPSELEAPTLRTVLSGDDANVDVSVLVRNRADAARQLHVRGTLRHGSSSIALAFPAVRLAPGASQRVSTSVVVRRPALWAPGTPNLYAFHLEVPGEGTWNDRVGLREIRRSGDVLLLNGKRLRLHGASLHEDADGRGDALTPADMDAMVADLKAVGANATRAQHGLSTPLLERLDRAGILVWQGVGPVDAPGAWTSDTAALGHLARERVRATVRQERLHPSVIAWNLVNEVAGNGHDATEVSYVRDMARELHRTDPGRLVALDVWGPHPPKVAGHIYADVDAVGLTNYIGWYQDPLASRETITAALHAATLSFTRTFPGKVLIVSEFGAEANPQNAVDAPGGYGFQSWLLRRHIATYRSVPEISGMLVWNLRDFGVSPDFAGGSIKSEVPGIHVERGLNTKGIFAYDGRPKPAAAAVRRAFAPLGDGLSAP